MRRSKSMSCGHQYFIYSISPHIYAALRCTGLRVNQCPIGHSVAGSVRILSDTRSLCGTACLLLSDMQSVFHLAYALQRVPTIIYTLYFNLYTLPVILNAKTMASISEKIGYGFGDMASSMFWKVFSYYLPFFYANVFGISLIDTGVLLLCLLYTSPSPRDS